MDGFYVAKFKVERRPKGRVVAEEKSEEVMEEAENKEDIAFDSEEDRPYIEEATRRRIKAKGLRPPPRSKAAPAVRTAAD